MGQRGLLRIHSSRRPTSKSKARVWQRCGLCQRRHVQRRVFGNDVFVRLPEGERTQLLKEENASLLEPMPGRALKEYVIMPGAWRGERQKAQEWVPRSFGWASQMPEKRSKRAKKGW